MAGKWVGRNVNGVSIFVPVLSTIQPSLVTNQIELPDQGLELSLYRHFMAKSLEQMLLK